MYVRIEDTVFIFRVLEKKKKKKIWNCGFEMRQEPINMEMHMV